MHKSLNGKTIAGGVETPSKKVRDANIELFRIITIMLIVAHHYVVNSGLTSVDGPIYADPLSWRSLFLLIFGAWGKIGINCFVLITGYFMCKSKITAKKFMKLLLEVMFYRVVISAVFWITGYEPFTVAGLLKTIIPVQTVGVGFTSAFLVFYLLIPFLSILVQNLNQRQHIFLLLWCGFTYVFLGTIPGLSVTMNYVSWFSVLFVIASYLRLYPKKVYERTKIWGWLTLGFVLASAVSVIACVWIGTKLHRNMAYEFVTDSNAFLAVGTGVCAFMFFKNLKIGYSKLINTIATSTFGVLLIHAHSDTMREWLWKDVLDNVGHYGSSIMPLHAIGAVFLIFFICILIDQVRIRFIEKPFSFLLDKKWDGFLERYKKTEEKLFSKIGAQGSKSD